MSLREFIRSEDTEFAFRVALGGAIPLVVLGWLGYPQDALLVMIGSTFISGIDIPAELPRKLRLMTFSLVVSPLVFAAVSLTYSTPVLFYPLISVLLFLISFIAPFSYHFGKVAFMFNLAIILSLGFSVSLTGVQEVLRAAGLVFAGGLWYMVFASLMHFLQRPLQITRRVSDTLDATAEYFKARSAFFQPGTDKLDVLLKLTDKQAQLTDHHEKVRAVMMRDFHYSSNMKAPIGRLVHFFASLVDLFDAAMATAWKLGEAEGIEADLPVNNILFEINDSIAQVLFSMREYLKGDRSLEELLKVRRSLQEKEKLLKEKLRQMRLNMSDEDRVAQLGEEYYDYKTIQVYTEDQMMTLEYMADLLEGSAKCAQWGIQEKDLPFFETRDQIRLEKMYSHLTFQSGYFRYALRVMITAVTAYAIVRSLGFQNPNWALLTVLVILKPGYRVSRDRLVRRIVGTALGVIIGYLLFTLFTPTHLVSQLVFMAAFFGGFAFANSNYAVATTFFTVYVLFIYAFLERNVETSAFFRISNTVLAAILSVFSIRFLFPYWENRNMKYYLLESLKATRLYLKVIYGYLKEPESEMRGYKLARKDAHLAMGNLTHSYQRILSEPKSKQGNISDYSSWVLSASSILAVCSNIGLFLRREPDYVMDQEYMISYFDWLLEYFDKVNQAIEQHTAVSPDAGDKAVIKMLKEDRSRLKKESNRLAFGYTEIYVARVNEYFIVNELLTLYHIIDHLETTTRDSGLLRTGQTSIRYS